MRQPRFADCSPRERREFYPSLTKAFRRAPRGIAAVQALAAGELVELPPRIEDPDAPRSDLERLTERFRIGLARRHFERVREATVRYAQAFAQWDGSTDSCDVAAATECGTCGRRSHVEVIDGHAMWIDCEGDGVTALTVQRAELVEEMREAMTSRKWHVQRERGQRERFEKVRACGSRVIVAKCSLCGAGTGKKGELRMVPEGCGVRRVCQRCDTQGAMQRRARFGRARGRCFIEGDRYALRNRWRTGGRYTEKMLTLTVPHFGLADARPSRSKAEGVKERARDDLHARIEALWLAWPKFNRKVVEHLHERGEDHFAWHRAFEWTPGVDGIGHPHFHVYWFAPFVHVDLIRQWWADALREVGWRVDRSPDVSDVYPEKLTVRRRRGSKFRARVRDRIIVHLKMLREFDTRAVRELLKGGRREALTLSRIDWVERGDYGSAGVDGFAYAEGWTIGDVEKFCSSDVRARLYMALEGKRLTQASSGFFVEDLPPVCSCCGHAHWFVKFEPSPVEEPVIGFSVAASSSRGPPS